MKCRKERLKKNRDSCNCSWCRPRMATVRIVTEKEWRKYKEKFNGE